MYFLTEIRVSDFDAGAASAQGRFKVVSPCTDAKRRESAKVFDAVSSIRKALERGDRLDFDDTGLYAKVFALAEARARKPLPRAMIPGIKLESPKITRELTTAWFATRVDERYQRCLAR